MSRHLARVDEIQQNYRIQRGELFKRIRLSTFAQLVLQVDQVNSMNESSLVEDDDENDQLIVPTDSNGCKRGSSFLDVINGTGEITLKNRKVENALPPTPSVPLEQTPYSQM